MAGLSSCASCNVLLALRRFCCFIASACSLVSTASRTRQAPAQHVGSVHCLLVTLEIAGCSACQRGSYQSASKQANCLQCDAGTAQPQSAQASCTSCTAGRYSPKNATVCSVCGHGAYSADKATQCTPCPAGSFSNSTTAANSCPLCPKGLR